MKRRNARGAGEERAPRVPVLPEGVGHEHCDRDVLVPCGEDALARLRLEAPAPADDLAGSARPGARRSASGGMASMFRLRGLPTSCAAGAPGAAQAADMDDPPPGRRDGGFGGLTVRRTSRHGLGRHDDREASGGKAMTTDGHTAVGGDGAGKAQTQPMRTRDVAALEAETRTAPPTQRRDSSRPGRCGPATRRADHRRRGHPHHPRRAVPARSRCPPSGPATRSCNTDRYVATMEPLGDRTPDVQASVEAAVNRQIAARLDIGSLRGPSAPGAPTAGRATQGPDRERGLRA